MTDETRMGQSWALLRALAWEMSTGGRGSEEADMRREEFDQEIDRQHCETTDPLQLVCALTRMYLEGPGNLGTDAEDESQEFGDFCQ